MTEARAGIYMVWDLAQLSRKCAATDEIAVSVLSSVIGQSRYARTIILDAGALALSKDIGANPHLPDAGYGYLCDPRTMRRLGALAVNAVHQEHGTVLVEDEAGSLGSRSAASFACCQTMPASPARPTMPSMPCAAAMSSDAFPASTAGEDAPTSSRRTLIFPSIGSVEGGGERVIRSPSKLTPRVCTLPVKLWFQEISQ